MHLRKRIPDGRGPKYGSSTRSCKVFFFRLDLIECKPFKAVVPEDERRLSGRLHE